jgi:biopolymer transport protein ExbD
VSKQPEELNMSDKSRDRALRARIRARVRRAIHRAEEEEHEGGELNLVPYLDIVVNTMIFLLACTATTAPLAHVHASSPKTDPVTQERTKGPPPAGSEGLNLTVAISYKGFIVAGRGGVMRDDAGQLPTVPCTRPLVRDTCRRRGYDYEALTRLAAKIKKQYPHERRVYLTADRNVPYQVVVSTMDALRGVSDDKSAKPGRDQLFDRVVFAAGVQ